MIDDEMKLAADIVDVLKRLSKLKYKKQYEIIGECQNQIDNYYMGQREGWKDGSSFDTDFRHIAYRSSEIIKILEEHLLEMY